MTNVLWICFLIVTLADLIAYKMFSNSITKQIKHLYSLISNIVDSKKETDKKPKAVKAIIVKDTLKRIEDNYKLAIAPSNDGKLLDSFCDYMYTALRNKAYTQINTHRDISEELDTYDFKTGYFLLISWLSDMYGLWCTNTASEHTQKDRDDMLSFMWYVMEFKHENITL